MAWKICNGCTFRSARTRPLQEWVRVLSWNGRRRGWTPWQTNRCLLTVQEISLAPWITYFTLVRFPTNTCTVKSPFGILQRIDANNVYMHLYLFSCFFVLVRCSGLSNSGIIAGAPGWGELKKRHSSAFSRVVLWPYRTFGRVQMQA